MTALSDAPVRDSTVPSERPAPTRGIVVAAGVLTGVVGLGFFFVTRSDMWLDEALSVNVSRLPLSDLHAALKHDGAPPLYYVLLHVWTSLFGTSDTAARSLSGICMVGAVVAIWLAARRFAGTMAAWLAAILTLSNPYAIRYATEARMYALEILLVACGVVVFQRVVDAPTTRDAAIFALVVALSLYTQYWSFYLLVVVVVLLVWMLTRTAHRDAARRLLVATAAGVAAFVPWLPTFLYQRAHTGTPWGTPLLPGLPFAYTLRDFAGGASGTAADRQEGWLLFFILIPLLLLGVFARARDERHVELDIRTQRDARVIAFVGGVGLVVALSLNYLAGGAFQSRYSAIVFPFFVLLIARGLTMFLDRRVLAVVAAAAVGFGFGGGVRNVLTQRTQAGQVASVLRADAHRGDAVVYCPDQLAPGVHRLGPRALDEFVYPSFAGPAIVDWVDYKKRLARADVQSFARGALARAGSRTLWYVSAPGYATHKGVCEALGDSFAAVRARLPRTISDDKIFEKPGLEEFPPHRAAG